ncbi:hypothetical protein V7121_00490 [Neobacillus drentensis]
MLDLEERERLLAVTVRLEFRLVKANGTCHEVSGRNTYASNSYGQVEEIQVLNSSNIGSLALH